MNLSTNERRRDRIEHLRLPEDDQVQVYDFSEGGIGVFLDTQQPGGTVFNMQISVGNLKISAKAKVAHCTIYGKRYRTGFQYVDIKKADMESLREMSSRYSRGVPVKVQMQSPKK